jgi:hypothetical protein
MKTYTLAEVYHTPVRYKSKESLLVEGLNAKDIVMDIIQIGVASGAVVVSGGAGGDTVTDVLFAVEKATDVLEEVTGIIGELAELGSILHAAVKLDFAGNPQNFYNDVKGLVKRTVASGLVGETAKNFIEDVAETVYKVIGKLVRAISKWVSALFPDDFGLSGPAFEATMSTAISSVAANSYNLATGAVEALGETGKLITDSDALEAFLLDITDSAINYGEKVNDIIQNPDPEKATLMGSLKATAKLGIEIHPLVATGAWAARKMGMDTDTLAEDYLDVVEHLHPKHPASLMMKKILPKGLFALEQIRDDWIPAAAEVMHKLISWLFAAIALFQMIMNPKERKEILAVKTRKSDFDPLGIEGLDDLDIKLGDEDVDMTQRKLAAHRYLSNELLIREWVRLRLGQRVLR